MKVIAKLKKEPGLWLSEADIPDIKPDEVLIKIHKTAVCGTDLHIYLWDEWAQQTIPVPMHVGHEFYGKIVDIGAQVKGFALDDRVSGEGHITCGHCRNCRGGTQHLCKNHIGVGVTRAGCFAEYLAIPATNVFKVPNSIHDDLVAIFDPLGNAVHTALSFDLTGEDVLITGAGPIGLMAIRIAKHVGARHVVISDINPYRLALAEKLGVSKAINVANYARVEDVDRALQTTMSDLGMSEGFDVGLEMSGNPKAITSMVNVMNHGGRMALLGIPSGDISINWNQVIFKGLFLKGIYGREMFETWYKMASLLQSGLDVSPIITHHFQVDAFEEAFAVMKTGNCGKVILDWTA